MKKALSLLLLSICVLNVTGCGKEDDGDSHKSKVSPYIKEDTLEVEVLKEDFMSEKEAEKFVKKEFFENEIAVNHKKHEVTGLFEKPLYLDENDNVNILGIDDFDKAFTDEFGDVNVNGTEAYVYTGNNPVVLLDDDVRYGDTIYVEFELLDKENDEELMKVYFEMYKEVDSDKKKDSKD